MNPKVTVTPHTRLTPVIGFSTGSLYKSFSNLHDQITALRILGCPAIELNLIRSSGMAEQFQSLQPGDLDDFTYVSVHAPTAPLSYADNRETWEAFYHIKRIHRLRALDAVVFHPDTVSDLSVFDGQPFPVAFENMDRRKTRFRTVEEMEGLLNDNEYGLVLDVNHAYSIDPVGDLVRSFWRKLGHRVTQVHLSGYAGYHEALHEWNQENIIQTIEDFSVPIIVESVLTPDNIAKEYEYILNAMAK